MTLPTLTAAERERINQTLIANLARVLGREIA